MSEDFTIILTGEEEVLTQETEVLVQEYVKEVHKVVFTNAVSSGKADLVRALMDIGFNKDTKPTWFGYDHEAEKISLYHDEDQPLLSLANEEIAEILENGG